MMAAERQREIAGQRLRELAIRMARAIVGAPDRVQVETLAAPSVIVLELRVDAADMGRIIGKGGQVANAMRLLLRTSAAKDGQRVSLEITRA